jgi:hypothetical protein
MGYTHYWTFEPNKAKDTETLRKKFKRASKQIKAFANFLPNKGIKICGGLGEGAPIFNETEVWFNGDRSEGLDHETFSVHWSRPSVLGKWNDFCKTARKPYDILVCFALLTFVEIFPEAFEFSSDGDMEDIEWQQGVEYYETFTGKTAKLPKDILAQAD